MEKTTLRDVYVSCDSELERDWYVQQKMINEGMYFESVRLKSQKVIGNAEEFITLYIRKGEWIIAATLYANIKLSPLQREQIIKDIVAIYERENLTEFKEIIMREKAIRSEVLDEEFAGDEVKRHLKQIKRLKRELIV